MEFGFFFGKLMHSAIFLVYSITVLSNSISLIVNESLEREGGSNFLSVFESIRTTQFATSHTSNSRTLAPTPSKGTLMAILTTVKERGEVAAWTRVPYPTSRELINTTKAASSQTESLTFYPIYP
jgi:hypothetical protein